MYIQTKSFNRKGRKGLRKARKEILPRNDFYTIMANS
jgi:hypothetical protein